MRRPAAYPAVILPQPDNRLEFYETPETFTRWLFETVPIAGHVFSPCAGSGAIHAAVADATSAGRRKGSDAHGDPLISRWTEADLDPRWGGSLVLDATLPASWGTVQQIRPIDWTVDNPPFTEVLPILRLALEHSRQGVAFHLRVSIHEPLKRGPRVTFLREHPPTRILFLPRFAFQRSKTTGRWSTDSACSCWCIWERATTLLPQESRIYYPPDWVFERLKAETPGYRARMDALMESFRG